MGMEKGMDPDEDEGQPAWEDFNCYGGAKSSGMRQMQAMLISQSHVMGMLDWAYHQDWRCMSKFHETIAASIDDQVRHSREYETTNQDENEAFAARMKDIEQGKWRKHMEGQGRPYSHMILMITDVSHKERQSQS